MRELQPLDLSGNQFTDTAIQTIGDQKRAVLAQKTAQKRQSTLGVNSVSPEQSDVISQSIDDILGNGGTSNEFSVGNSIVDHAQASLYNAGGQLYDAGLNTYGRVTGQTISHDNQYWDNLSNEEFANAQAGYDPTYDNAQMKIVQDKWASGDYLGAAGQGLNVALPTLAGSAGSMAELAGGSLIAGAATALAPEVGIATAAAGTIAKIASYSPKAGKALDFLMTAAKGTRNAALYGVDQAERDNKELIASGKPPMDNTTYIKDVAWSSLLGSVEIPIFKQAVGEGTVGALKETVKNLAKVSNPGSNGFKILGDTIWNGVKSTANTGGKEAAQEYLEFWKGEVFGKDKELLKSFGTSKDQSDALFNAMLGAVTGSLGSNVGTAANLSVTGTTLATRGLVKKGIQGIANRATDASYKVLSPEKRAYIKDKYDARAKDNEEATKSSESIIKAVEKANTQEELSALSDDTIDASIALNITASKDLDPDTLNELKDRYNGELKANIKAKLAEKTDTSKEEAKVLQKEYLSINKARNSSELLNALGNTDNINEVKDLIDASEGKPLTKNQIKAIKNKAISLHKAKIAKMKVANEATRVVDTANEIGSNMSKKAKATLNNYGITEENLNQAYETTKEKATQAYEVGFEAVKNVNSSTARGLGEMIIGEGAKVSKDAIEVAASAISDTDLDSLIKATDPLGKDGSKYNIANKVLKRAKKDREAALKELGIIKDSVLKSFNKGSILSDIHNGINKSLSDTEYAKLAKELDEATSNQDVTDPTYIETMKKAYEVLKGTSLSTPMANKISSSINRLEKANEGVISKVKDVAVKAAKAAKGKIDEYAKSSVEKFADSIVKGEEEAKLQGIVEETTAKVAKSFIPKQLQKARILYKVIAKKVKKVKLNAEELKVYADNKKHIDIIINHYIAKGKGAVTSISKAIDDLDKSIDKQEEVVAEEVKINDKGTIQEDIAEDVTETIATEETVAEETKKPMTEEERKVAMKELVDDLDDLLC